MSRRHESLIALSHDHHHGLALALRLRQGDEALLLDGWTHDRREQARRVQEFFEDELIPHFLVEEQVLFPKMRAYVPSARKLVDDLMLQHRQVRQLIEQMHRADDAALPGLLVTFGTLLDIHIRTEERELFQMYQSELPESILSGATEEMDHARSAALASRGSAIHVRAERLIPARSEAVFQFLLNVSGYFQWWPEPVSFTLLEPMADRLLGALIELSGPEFQTVFAVEEIRENQFFGWSVAQQRLEGYMQWMIDESGEGTRISFELTIRPKGPEAGEASIDGLKTGRFLQHMADQALDSLQQRFQTLGNG